MNTKPKILIVDDEEVVRLSYSRILAATDCRVEAVWTWTQVSQLMQQEPFDVVLLDLRMPGVDGMTILRALKQRWPESEVVIITGYPTLESAKEAVALGAHDYLAKPVGPEQVIDAAESAMLHKKWALHCDVPPREQGIDESPAIPASATDAGGANSMRRSS
ncbi:MAG TPA: response regulator [Albitalea sp.]|nr:response regulator [Albitalea sp.]